MYRRILVVTGDQPWVDTSVEYAITLAAETGAELSILTVPLLPLLTGMPDCTWCSPLVLENVVVQRQIVLNAAATMAEQAGVSYSMHIRWGQTATMILHTADEVDCDLIIVGSHTDSWRSRWLSNYVIKTLTACARQPLLLTTERPPGAASGPTWSRLLVVHDGSARSEAAVYYALALAQEAALDVCLLYVNTPRRHDAVDPLGVTHSVQDMLTLAATHTAIAGVSHDVVLASGHLVTAIVDTAADRECDVIVLGVEPSRGWKRLLHGQTARAVMLHTARPVLLVNHLATYGD
jgi:nucleotide-binding universal stress UspA family protein